MELPYFLIGHRRIAFLRRSKRTIVIDPRRVQLFPQATFSEGQIDSPALESEI
jgi:hypothetical protein